MLKVSHFLGESEHGLGAIPLFGPADLDFEKVAAPSLLPDVVKYIESLTPNPESQYVLVNAMGAGEFYGSNINGDHFPEAALIHAPDDWKGVPIFDKTKAKGWAYGFPTFYGAHPYAHHRNKNPERAFGEVELATWNDHMKRVELVVRCDREKCHRFGGVGVWDKLKLGQFPDVSMGTKVPFDTCSICLDWDLFRKGVSQYIPGKHKHPGVAVLAFHKRLKKRDGIGIRGLSITRKDYCEHARKLMNRILPDGRKVWVRNDYPRFFDISFVFIGADKTAKVMLFIFSGGKVYRVKPSAEVAEDMGVTEPKETRGSEKTASLEDEILKRAFLGKDAKDKKGEITKDVVPSQFAGKAVPFLNRREKSMPNELLDSLGCLPMRNTLSTLAGMGIPLRPHEFQRITLIQLDKRALAEDYERRGVVFPKTASVDEMEMGEEFFLPVLARRLLPFLEKRSGLAPFIERRVVVLSGRPEDWVDTPASHPSELLRKIGSAYNGYRNRAMELAASTQTLLGSELVSSETELQKFAAAQPEEVITPLSYNYLRDAFMNECAVGVPGAGVVKVSTIRPSASVERVPPSVNT